MTDLPVKTGVGGTKIKKVIGTGTEEDPFIDVMALSDEAGNVVSVQNPVPTDGDSVYVKDVKDSLSDVGTFTGADLTTMFDNLDTSIVDSSAENPKWFMFKLERPITSGGIGVVAHTGNFSNVHVEFMDRQENVLAENDDSSNNTPYNARRYPLTARDVCCIKVSFHTGDPVTVSFLRIATDTSVVARIKYIKPDGTEVEGRATAGGVPMASLQEYDEVFLTNPLPVREYGPNLDGDNYLSIHLQAASVVNMAVDGSSTPVEYSYTVPVGKKLMLNRGFLAIEDGVTAFAPGNFGAISGPLGNGLEISITPNGESKQVLETWQTNRQIRDSMFDFDQQFKADGAYIGRWTFSKDIGSSFVLNAGDKISALNQDDLTGLDYLSIRIKGKIENV